MSITKERSGRLRVQVWDPSQGRNVSAAKVLGLPRDQATFPATRQGRRDAQAFREKARQHLAGNAARRRHRRRSSGTGGWPTRCSTASWKDGATGPTARHNTERTAGVRQTSTAACRSPVGRRPARRRVPEGRQADQPGPRPHGPCSTPP
jgi:hypothetical protein